jgi:dihydrofolate reductase
MNSSKAITGIMAATGEGVIAANHQLPWCYPDELAHFDQTTRGQVMIMGMKTYLTTPKHLLHNRQLIVLSKDPLMAASPTTSFVSSIDDCLTVAQKTCPTRKLFMIGGAEIAHQFLEKNLATRFLLTKIHHSYPGDTYLNLSYFESWSQETIETNADYTIVSLSANS